MSAANENPYRGWTMVQRPGGLFLTRDNLTYRRLPGSDPHEPTWTLRDFEVFHLLVDEMEEDG